MLIAMLMSFTIGFLLDWSNQKYLMYSVTGRWFWAGTFSVVIWLCAVYGVVNLFVNGLLPGIAFGAGLFAGTALAVRDAAKEREDV